MIERACQLKNVLSYVVLMVLSLYGSLVGICRSNAENGNSGEKASPDSFRNDFHEIYPYTKYCGRVYCYSY